MAGKRSDVELIITAKDDAEKKVKSLRKELALLQKKGVDTSQLDDAVEKLNTELSETIEKLKRLEKVKVGIRSAKQLKELNALTKKSADLREKISAKNSQIAKKEEANTKRLIKLRGLLNQAVVQERSAREKAARSGVSPELRQRLDGIQKMKVLMKQAAASQKDFTTNQRKELLKLEASYRKAGGSLKVWNSILSKSQVELNKTTSDTKKLSKAQKAADAASGKAKGRSALSFYQRLRSEVIGLTAAYVGLRGVADGVSAVFNTQNKLLAARNRFEVGFGGDAKKAGQEMKFIENSARKLGVQIEDTLEDYSKFVAASNGLGFSQTDLRKVFIGTTKAIVVNKLSADDAKGVYRALTQIMSKNQVMAEELRLQLGDRLPGALTFMAQSLGVTTAELNKMMEQGQISADALIGFAATLESKFGPNLGKVLDSPQAKMVEFQNALFDLRKALAESGFIDELTAQLKEFTAELAKPESKEALKALARGLVIVAKVALELVKNIDKVMYVLGAFGALKIAGAVSSVAKTFARISKKALPLIKNIGKLTGVLKILRIALVALGGPVGIVATALGLLGIAFFKLSKRAESSRDKMDSWNSSIVETKDKLGIFTDGVNDAVTAVDSLEQLTSAPFEVDLKLATGKIIEGEALLANLEAKKRQLENARRTGSRRLRRATKGESAEELDVAIAKLKADISQLKAKTDELVGDLERQLRAIANSGTRVIVEKLSDDAQRAYKKILDDYTKRSADINALEAKTLDDRLKLIKDKNKNEEDLIRAQADLRVKLAEQRIKRIEQLQEGSGISKSSFDELLKLGQQGQLQALAKGSDPADDSLRKSYVQANEEITKSAILLSEYNSLLVERNELLEVIPSIDAKSAFQQAEVVKSFYTQAAADIGADFKDALTLDEKVDISDAKAKFAELQAELNTLLAGSSGPVAESVRETMRVVALQQKSFITSQLSSALNDINAEIAETAGQNATTQIRLIREKFDALRTDFSVGQDDGSTEARSVDKGERAALVDALSQAQEEYNTKIAQTNEARLAGLEIDSLSLENLAQSKEEFIALLDLMIQMSEDSVDPIPDITKEQLNKWKLLRAEMTQTQKFTTALGKVMKVQFADQLSASLSAIVDRSKTVKQAFGDMARAMVKFVADLMIKWAVLSALSRRPVDINLLLGGVGTGSILNADTKHTGGIAGSTGRTTRVPASVFQFAPRYHSGGIAGLAPDEVPTVLKRGEEVLTEGDPRHRGNGGASSTPQNITVVNAIDSASVVSEGMATSEGTKSILNVVKANRSAFKQVLA